MGWASHSFLLAAIALSALTVPARAEGGGDKTAQGAPSSAYEKCLDTGEARMGVMPAMASVENWPSEYDTAPTSRPSI